MRDVYFDPFGSYTQGYDKGTQRQMDLEANTRAARDSDYKYNVLNPYELKSIQRTDKLGEYALPAQFRAVDYADDLGRDTQYARHQALNEGLASRLGITQPWEAEAYSRYVIDPQRTTVQTPTFNEHLEAAKIAANKAVAALPDLSLVPGETTEAQVNAQEKQIKAIKAHVAAVYGVHPESLTEDSPELPPTQTPQVDYYIGGQHVGAMQNPQQSILADINRPRQLDVAKMQQEWAQQAWENQYNARKQDSSDAWLQIERQRQAGSGGTAAPNFGMF
jgi:hypothetical protein